MQNRKFHIIIFILLLFNFEGVVIINAQCSSFISTFPYTEDFESGPGGWFSGGISNDWVLGTPAKPTINSAGNGTQAWITGGLIVPFYNYGERSWVQSPCFDFTNLQYPILRFKIFWELENQFDGGNLQYSIDGGNNWSTLGGSSEPDNCINQNWYTIRSVTNLSGFTSPSSGWSGTIQGTSGSCRGGNGLGEWRDAQHCISELAGETSVIFRFTMGSGTTCNDYDGIAFDHFQIFEATPIPYLISYTCVGTNQIQFNEDLETCHDQWLWDFGDPSSLDNSDTLPSPIHIFSGPGIFNVQLSAGSSCIPAGITSISIEVLSIDTVIIPVTCSEGNDGEASVLVQNPPPGLSYLWSTFPIQTSSTATLLGAGNYTVTVSAPGVCDINLNLDIGYGPDAFPFVTLGPDTVLCPGNPIVLFPGAFSGYEWQDGSSDSLFIAYSGGIFSVGISNNAGCQSSDTLIIEEDCLGDILFPNSFTPNSDGKNEVFHTVGNLISSYELIIFNRWGQKVFTSIDAQSGWNGEMNGVPQQEGIYIFKAIYSIREGEAREKIGKVTLIR